MTDLQIPFGAVYFRKSNPPKDDWDRDYGVASDDGLNIFRHWFMWAAIERAPGQYDWEEYDRQLDLAARHGIKTIIAELTHTVPDWAYRKFSHARQRKANGDELASVMGVSSATGGFANNGGGAGTLTMNCPEVKEAAGAFLTAMAERYKGHPGLLGYDVWNECNYSPDVDYNDYTKTAFRDWLKAKYGSLDALANAWYRYGHAEWEDIEPPTAMRPFPECLDWLKFKKENFYDQMQFRIDTIRKVDADCMIAAHGVAGAITDMASRGCDDWLAASKVETYGYTWIPARKGNQPWRNFFAADLVRGASRGKPFWHAERQGGPLWMQPQVLGRDKEDGRVTDPEDIRLWCMCSFAGGARGMMNLRYRPLLDGPLFGAFGSYGMDGSRTPRSDMASSLAKWCNEEAQRDLFAARPVRGEIGILVVPEVQEFDYLLSREGGFETYSQAMWGAYRGFFDNQVQADWVHIDDIDAYEALYFPYPIMFTAKQAERIAAWVAGGGTLICEACPGYFGDRGKVGTRQPNNGLHEIFGAVETDVEFMPDIADRYGLELGGLDLTAGGFIQSYEPQGGKVLGHFRDGRIAVVQHEHGKGRTLLIGTHPTVSYYNTGGEAQRRYFRYCLDWAGIPARLSSDNPNLQMRLHEGEGRYLWIVNPSRDNQSGRIEADGLNLEGELQVLWPVGHPPVSASQIEIAGRDALILKLPENA